MPDFLQTLSGVPQQAEGQPEQGGKPSQMSVDIGKGHIKFKADTEVVPEVFGQMNEMLGHDQEMSKNWARLIGLDEVRPSTEVSNPIPPSALATAPQVQSSTQPQPAAPVALPETPPSLEQALHPQGALPGQTVEQTQAATRIGETPPPQVSAETQLQPTPPVQLPSQPPSLSASLAPGVEATVAAQREQVPLQQTIPERLKKIPAPAAKVEVKGPYEQTTVGGVKIRRPRGADVTTGVPEEAREVFGQAQAVIDSLTPELAEKYREDYEAGKTHHKKMGLGKKIGLALLLGPRGMMSYDLAMQDRDYLKYVEDYDRKRGVIGDKVKLVEGVMGLREFDLTMPDGSHITVPLNQIGSFADVVKGGKMPEMIDISSWFDSMPEIQKQLGGKEIWTTAQGASQYFAEVVRYYTSKATAQARGKTGGGEELDEKKIWGRIAQLQDAFYSTDDPEVREGIRKRIEGERGLLQGYVQSQGQLATVRAEGPAQAEEVRAFQSNPYRQADTWFNSAQEYRQKQQAYKAGDVSETGDWRVTMRQENIPAPALPPQASRLMSEWNHTPTEIQNAVDMEMSSFTDAQLQGYARYATLKEQEHSTNLGIADEAKRRLGQTWLWDGDLYEGPGGGIQWAARLMESMFSEPDPNDPFARSKQTSWEQMERLTREFKTMPEWLLEHYRRDHNAAGKPEKTIEQARAEAIKSGFRVVPTQAQITGSMRKNFVKNDKSEWVWKSNPAGESSPDEGKTVKPDQGHGPWGKLRFWDVLGGGD